MNHLGYDAVTLGNHEFDLLPTGAADIVGHRGAVSVLATNLTVADPVDPWGDAIQDLIDSGDIVEYQVQTLANGLKVGYIGIMGEEADSVINKPFGSDVYPIEFTDMVAAASSAVTYLKDTEGVDIVICLSHSGVNEPEYWLGEDIDLAAAVPGLDVIISGHTHTYIPAPVVVGNTIVVQAASYTSRLGVLELERVGGVWTVLGYESTYIDDTIPGDAAAQSLIQQYIDKLNLTVLEPMGYPFSDAIAETDFELKKIFEVEHNIGNLVTDSIRWAVDQALANPSDPVDVAVESNGVIRSALLPGTTGLIQTSDAFRTLPLGIDTVSGDAGYPLLSFCLYGSEVYSAALVNALSGLLNNSDYWLSWSGMGFSYIPYYVLNVWQCLDGSDPTCASQIPVGKDSVMHRIAANSYLASNIGNVEELSYGLISIVPKDCSTGLPLTSLADAIVYEAPGDPLLQWEAFFDFLASLPDTDDPPDGIPNIPARYAGIENRMQKACVVATVSYGSPAEENVSLLRDFRDKILMKSSVGRKFVDLYYTYGPQVAQTIAQSEWLKAMVRILLLPLVGVAKVLLLLV
jgi:5'-nucleotidase/UDP-sugar diphosphatase